MARAAAARNYTRWFTQPISAKIERRVEECIIPSAGGSIHLDFFRCPGPGMATGTIVFQADRDRMIPPQWSRICYERLGCAKAFVKIHDCGHWAIRPPQVEFTATAMAGWFGRHAKGQTLSGG